MKQRFPGKELTVEEFFKVVMTLKRKGQPL